MFGEPSTDPGFTSKETKKEWRGKERGGEGVD